MKYLSLWKTLFLLLICFSTNLNAQQVRANLTAAISYIYDPAGIVDDLSVGSLISGSYTYETDTPDSDSSDNIGLYRHTRGTGDIEIQLGSHRINSRTTAETPLEILIHKSSSSVEEDDYSVRSFELLGSDGIDVNDLYLDLRSEQGMQALTSDDLTAEVPKLSRFNAFRELYISGSKNGSRFYLRSIIKTLVAENIPEQTSFSYKLTARLIQLDDLHEATGAKVGDTVTAIYTIDTTTPVLEYGGIDSRYIHEPGKGRINVEVGSYIFKSDRSANTPEVMVHNEVLPGNYDNFNIHSWFMNSSGNEMSDSYCDVNATNAEISFWGQDALSSTRMPTSMNLQDWEDAVIMVNGPVYGCGYNQWSAVAEIVNIEPVETEDFVSIVPGDAPIHYDQRFDMAIRLDDLPELIDYSGYLNDRDITAYLRTSCDPFNSYDGFEPQVLLCRNTRSILEPGKNTLSIRLEFAESKTVTKQVIWTVR